LRGADIERHKYQSLAAQSGGISNMVNTRALHEASRNCNKTLEQIPTPPYASSSSKNYFPTNVFGRLAASHAASQLVGGFHHSRFAQSAPLNLRIIRPVPAAHWFAQFPAPTHSPRREKGLGPISQRNCFIKKQICFLLTRLRKVNLISAKAPRETTTRLKLQKGCVYVLFQFYIFPRANIKIF